MFYLTEKYAREYPAAPDGTPAKRTTPMPIELKCYATLAPMTPSNADAFPLKPGETVLGLIDRLGVPHEEVKIVFVNGVTVALDKPLADGDRVGIFPPVGGG